ncbi:hypothetical protein SESBI_21241 [Sesbania bispinosa]|nr:hypothetical protein SESBI_21241 [Sesbania bispinosa]
MGRGTTPAVTRREVELDAVQANSCVMDRNSDKEVVAQSQLCERRWRRPCVVVAERDAVAGAVSLCSRWRGFLEKMWWRGSGHTHRGDNTDRPE